LQIDRELKLGCQSWPGRFGGFGAPPLPDVDGALAELAHANDVLKLDGIVLFSNANGVHLGEAMFEEPERRRAVVLVHPTDAARSAKGPAVHSSHHGNCGPAARALSG
jgi:hypothetical protein